MEYIALFAILFGIFVLAFGLSKIYLEQQMHNKQLEKILKEQTDLLIKIEQENRLIRIAVKSK